MNYIGPQGIIAGGAIRDLVLGHAPKDYDIFLHKEPDFKKIVSRKGIFDKMPEEVKIPSKHNYPASFTTFFLYNTTLKGCPVQIIWSKEYVAPEVAHIWRRKFGFKPTGEEIVYGFDFTINMMYVDHNKRVFITDDAKVAMKKKKIIFNRTHKASFSNRLDIVEHLFKRMVYLADKLDFVIECDTIDRIYCAYTPKDYDIESMKFVKETSNAIF